MMVSIKMKGIFKYATGSVYDGEWEDDKQQEKGILKYVIDLFLAGNDKTL